MIRASLVELGASRSGRSQRPIASAQRKDHQAHGSGLDTAHGGLCAASDANTTDNPSNHSAITAVQVTDRYQPHGTRCPSPTAHSEAQSVAEDDCGVLEVPPDDSSAEGEVEFAVSGMRFKPNAQRSTTVYNLTIYPINAAQNRALIQARW